MAKLIPVEVFDLIIFGGTGDLAMRKLLPALYHRDRDAQLTPDSRIISIGRGKLERSAYLDRVRKSLRANLCEGEYDAANWKTFSNRIQYVQADGTRHEEWDDLVAAEIDPARNFRQGSVGLLSHNRKYVGVDRNDPVSPLPKIARNDVARSIVLIRKSHNSYGF